MQNTVYFDLLGLHKQAFCAQIMVQLTAHVSLTGLPVLRTLYKPMSMHKSTNSQNCEFCVL